MSAVAQAVVAAVADAPARVLVAFSGGLDSTVLLHAAAGAVSSERLLAVHVDHGLDPAAADWQRHCAAVCGALGVRLTSRRVRVGGSGSVEARARAERYGVFHQVIGAGDRLLLAHHRDDQAETVLLRLLQGRGLYGMPAHRPLGAGVLLRPLLDLPRSDLVAYARRHHLSWVEDPGNRDETLDRNYLRHTLFPALRRRWPQVDAALTGASAQRRLADGLLLGPLGAANTLPVAELLSRNREQQTELLRLWLAARGVPAPSRGALAEFCRQLAAAPDRQPELPLPGAGLRRFRGRIWLAVPAPHLEPVYPVPGPGALPLPHGELRLIADGTGPVAAGDLTVTFRRGGERLAFAGGHRSLKQLFQEAGVPPWLRDSYPLLTDALGVLAVPGIGRREDGPAPARGAVRWRVEWHPEGRFRPGAD